MIVVGDTSGLVAAFNTAEPEHKSARAAFQGAAVTLVSPLVFAEIEHIMTRQANRTAAGAVQDWLLGQTRSRRVLIPDVSADVLRTARRVQTRYAALRLDLADAVNVAVAEHYETDAILTLDRRDFRAVRPLTEATTFRLLPDDL